MLARIRPRVRRQLTGALAAHLAVAVCTQPAARAEDPPPANDQPPVRIEPTNPRDRVSLYMLFPVGTVMRRGGPRLVYDRVLVCGRPCQYRPAQEGLYELDGPGLMPSNPFVLRPDTKTVRASMGSEAAMVIGTVLYVPGALGSVVLSLPALGCAIDGARDQNCVPLLSVAIASLLAAAGGLMLITHNRTKVSVSPPD
jgi:hypothetical protein